MVTVRAAEECAVLSLTREEIAKLTSENALSAETVQQLQAVRERRRSASEQKRQRRSSSHEDSSSDDGDDSSDDNKTGWEKMERNGKHYFWNWDTGETTWKRPPDYSSDQDANPEVAAAAAAAKRTGASKRGEGL